MRRFLKDYSHWMVLGEPKWYGIYQATIGNTILPSKATPGLRLALIFNQKQQKPEFYFWFYKKLLLKVGVHLSKKRPKCS